MTEGVPIIGQAKLGPWAVTLTVFCPCGALVLLVGQPGMRSGCASCHKVYELRGMPTLHPVTGALQVPLGVGMRTPKPIPMPPSWEG
jgi:hypothetical protein